MALAMAIRRIRVLRLVKHDDHRADLRFINSSPPGQNGRCLADDIFKCIFMNEKFCILIKISLKFGPKGPVYKKNSIGLNNGLAPNRRQVIIWTNADPIHWRIHTTLGGDEFNKRLTHGVYRHAKTKPPTTKNGCWLPDTIVSLMAKTPRWIIVNFTIWNQHQ